LCPSTMCGARTCRSLTNRVISLTVLYMQVGYYWP
jgi:hypothetical protein